MTRSPAGDAAALAAALLSVRQLDRSVAFYEQVFGLRVHTRHRDLALLESADGAPVLALRAIGEHAARGLEQVGISRLVWFASPAAAVRLREQLARAGVRELFRDDDDDGDNGDGSGDGGGGGATVVFSDPDGIAHVLVASAVPDWPGHEAIPRAAWLRGL